MSKNNPVKAGLCRRPERLAVQQCLVSETRRLVAKRSADILSASGRSPLGFAENCFAKSGRLRAGGQDVRAPMCVLEHFKPLGRIIHSTDRQARKKKAALPSGPKWSRFSLPPSQFLLLFGIGAYFWQKPVAGNSVNVLPPPPNPRGLFDAESSTEADDTEHHALMFSAA